MNFKKVANFFRKNRTEIFVALVFIISVAVFSLSFYIQRHFMNNFDENDHLAIGYLMKNGYLLYKDTFSHHFPLPYYWTYIFSFFWSDLPSRTISIFRMSILVLYLLVFLSVYFNYKDKRSKISFSLWILLLSLFFTLYHGNLVLSETFTAIFISGIFWITIPLLLSWEKYGKYKIILLMIFSSAAFWTQPLALPSLLLPLVLSRKKKFGSTLRRLVILNALPLILFTFSGQLKDFAEQTLCFNFSVYPKYYSDNLSEGNKIIQTIFYFLKNQIALFTKFTNNHERFQFIMNASFAWLLLYAAKLKYKKPLIVLLIILFLTRIREAKIIVGQPFNFGIYPYLIAASSSFIILLILHKTRKVFSAFLFLTICIISFSNWQKIFLQSLKPDYNYHVFWNHKRGIAEKINNLTKKGESVLIYPHDVDLYTLSNRLPPDRFTYWFPWINSVEKYRQERLDALKINPPAVIYIGSLDFKNEKDYYHRYFPNITEGYFRVYSDNKGEYEGVWVRNDLSDRINKLN